MIHFTVWKSDGQYRGYSCEGHAEYAEEGSDIVCAAVSALTLNAANSIEQLTDEEFRAEAAKDGGSLRVIFPKGAGWRAALLMDSLVLGLKGIQAEYGKKYITLKIEEV